LKNETTEKNKKSVSKRSFWLILAGFAFFINPVPFGLDIIPDAFGCIMLFFGLTQLAYFDGSVEDAKKSILYLTAVEFLHLLFMRSMFLTEISTNRLLAVTAFSIMQGIVYILFFKKLFSGISYFAMRNNCNQTLNKCDGTAFLSYLAFFVRIAATLIPELIALIEWKLYTEFEPDTHDAISAFVNMKPVIVVLFTLIALGTSIVWFVSLTKLLTLFKKEAGEMLDTRYEGEYVSRPEKVIPKKLRRGSYAIYFALFFALDIKFDNIRIIPYSAMFLLLFVAVMFFNKISDFKLTKRFALPAFLLVLATEFYRAHFTPNGAIIIYETDIKIVAIAAVLGLSTLTVCLYCIRTFLLETEKLSINLGLGKIPTTSAWGVYCISTILWSLGFVIPYFYSSISAPRFIATAIFIWQSIKIFEQINEANYLKTELYGK